MARKLMKGNEAVAEAAIEAGCRYFFGYPITPQNQIPELLSERLPQVGGSFLQAESEVAAINMVYGASGAGARVMTSSSSPGVALKSEGISYLAGGSLPCVIVNMQRGGPGLGSIQAAQGDYFMTVKGGGNGDYNLITLAPSSVQEAADLVELAFDLSDFYRCPAVILGDGLLAQMMEPAEIKPYKPAKDLPPKTWATCGKGKNGGKRNVISSLFVDPPVLEELNKRLQATYREIEKNEVRYETYNLEGAEYVFAAYGTVARIVKAAIKMLGEKGIKCGMIRPITVWPFPNEIFKTTAAQSSVKEFIGVEMSAGQMVEDVRLAVGGAKPVDFYGRMGSVIPAPQEIVDFVLAKKERG